MIIIPFKTDMLHGYAVQINKADALQLIASLAEQLRTGSPNSGRAEFRTALGEYFSVAVLSDDVLREQEKEQWEQKRNSAST